MRFTHGTSAPPNRPHELDNLPGRPLDRPKRRGHAASCTPSDLPRAIDGYTARAAAAECAEVQHSHGLTPEEGVLFLCGRDAVTRHVTALIDIVPDGAICRPGAAEVADVAKAIFLAPDERGAEEIADIAPTRDLFKVIDAKGLGIHPTKGAEVPHRA